MEDVSFMVEHGETETHVIFVDSSQRDLDAYPNPAEYTIPFDEPLRNVVGVDVLDSAVPSTMYVVDEHNRDTRMYVVATDTAVARHAVLAPNLSRYLAWWLQLEDDPALDAFSPAKETVTSVGTLEVVDVRVPVGLDGLGAPVYPAVEEPLLDDADTAIAYQRVLAVRDATGWLAGPGAPAPDPADGLLPAVVAYESSTFWVPARYAYGATRSAIVRDGAGFVLVTLARAFASQTGFRVACHRLQFPKGNYGTLKLLLQAGRDGGGGAESATTPAGGAYLTSASTDEDRLLQVRVNARLWGEDIGGKAALVAFDLGCGMSEVLGFAGSLADPGVVALEPRGGVVKKLYTNQVGGGEPAPFLAPSGVVNMTGERYIVLRCIEVEAGMFSSSTTGRRSTGIGLFKLPGPGALREQRQDYITVVKRPFHPIGRMDGLSLRMERGRAPGELYNFKGVNHLLVLAVKVLVPKRERAFQRSVLNPNYDRDFLRYSVAHRLRDDGESTDNRPVTPGDVERAMRRHEFLSARAPEPEAAVSDSPDGSEYGDSDSDDGRDRWARVVGRARR